MNTSLLPSLEISNTKLQLPPLLGSEALQVTLTPSAGDPRAQVGQDATGN